MKKMMIGLIVFFSLNQSTYACGNLNTWIDAYYGKGPIDAKNKKGALVGIYECGIYSYRGQDKKLLNVILDAKRNSVEISNQRYGGFIPINTTYNTPPSLLRLLEKIYRRYHCLKAASDEEGYANVVKIFGSCSQETLQQMSVSCKGTVNIRETPEGRKIGYLKNGSQVNVIGKEGEWFKINVPGSVRDSARVDIGYIHGSLLKP